MTVFNRRITSMLWVAIVIIATPFSAFAQYAPKSLNISGGLFLPSGLPVTSASVDFRLEIWDKGATCKLYEETHSAQNLSQTKGGFSLQLGEGTAVTNFVSGGPDLTWQVFANPGAPNTVVTGCVGGVLLLPGDDRLIRVHYNLGSGMTAMTPDVPIESSAYAMIADTIQGRTLADLIVVRDDVGTDLTQSNVENVFSASNYAKLVQLLTNTLSASYSFNNQTITNVGTPSAGGDAVNKTYADSRLAGNLVNTTGVANGNTLIWNGSAWLVGTPSAVDATKLPLAGGTMSGPVTFGGFDLYNTGHITMGSQRTFMLGHFTNAQEGGLGLGVGDEGRMFYNTELDALRLWNGAAFVGFGASGVAGGDLTGTYPNPTINVGTVTTAKIATDAITASKLDNAGMGINRIVMSDGTDPNLLRFKTCALNQILQWGATGWGCVDVGAALPNTGIAAGMYGSSTTVSRIGLNAQGVVTSAANVAIDFPVVSVNGKTGVVVLNGADLGLGTASLEDIGNGALEVPMTDAGGKLNPSVIPTLGIGDISGAITSIVASSPITGGGTSGVVTIGLDASQVDAAMIRGNTILAGVPADNQVLTWNNSASRWEARTPGAGADNLGNHTATANVQLGAFWLSGDGNNEGVFVDGSGRVGVGTDTPNVNAIFDINGLAGLSAMIVPRDSQAARPVGVNGMIRYNTNTARMEIFENGGWVDVVQTPDGGILNLSGTNGALVSGPALTKTISIDTGVTTGQIVQVAAGDRLPVIDGSNLTNIANLRGVNVSTTAPTVGQVLRHNGSAWEAFTPVDNAGVTFVAMGSGMLGGNITATGTLTIDVGTGPNQIVQLDGTSRLPAVDGSQLTNVNAVQIQSRDVAAGLPADNQVLTWNNAAAQWEARTPGAGADNLGSHIAAQHIQLNGFFLSGDGGAEGVFVAGAGNVGVGTNTPNANSILDVNGSGAMSALIVPRDAQAARPTGVNGMIRYNTNTAKMEIFENGGWTDVVQTFTDTDTGIVTLTGENGLLVSGPATVKTLTIDTGVTDGQIVQVTTGDRLPVIDGSNLTNISNLRGVNVSTTAPTVGQVLRHNGSAWEAFTPVDNQGVTFVAMGSGLIGGNITATGTVTVDVGIGPNQIPQLNANGFLGIGTATVTPGAVADFWGDTAANSAVMLPRATTANRPTTGVDGMIRYNTTLAKFEVYENGNWYNMATGTGADNLGNHTATANLRMGANWISSDGDSEGIRVNSSGLVGIGTATIPAWGANQAVLQVGGGATLSNWTGSDNELSLGSNYYTDSGPAHRRIVFGNANRYFVQNGDHSFQTAPVGGANSVLSWEDMMKITAAGSVGIMTSSPNTQTVLDVNGTGNISNMLIPRGSTAQRAVTAANGMIRYNTNLAAFEVYQNNAWATVSTSASPGDNLGNHTATTAILATTGTAATPSYTFATDTNTGLYSAGPDRLALTTNSVERVRINESGNVGIGTANPQAPMHVEGYIIANGSVPFSNSPPTYTDSINGWKVGLGSEYAAIGIGDWQVGVRSPYWISYYFDTPADDADTTNPDSNAAISFSTRTGGALFKGSVGIGTVSPNVGSILDLNGTGNLSSLLIPRGTTAERAATAANGMIRYNTNLAKFEVYENGNWTNMVSAGGGISGLTANSIPRASSPTSIVDGSLTDNGTTVSLANARTFSPLGNAADSIKIGTNSSATGGESTAYGYNADATGAGANAIGKDALANGSYSSALGRGANSAGFNSVAIGDVASAANQYSLAIGPDTDANFDSSVAFGSGSQTTATNQLVAGSDPHPINNIYFGKGATNAAPTAFTINGTQSTGAAAGGDIAISGGGRGSGVGGKVILRTGAGTTPQDRVTVMPIGNVGIGETSPNIGAILDLNGTGNLSSVLIPRGTTAERAATAANGMIRYNTNLAAFEVYANNAWATMATSATSGATNIDELSDAIYNTTAESLYMGNNSGAGQNNNRTGNTAVGHNSLASINNDSADQNAAFGRSALGALTTGNNNAAFGTNAGSSAVTSSGSTFLGNFAGWQSTGDGNTVVGDQAQAGTAANGNVSIGQFTGSANTTGWRNTLVGTDAAGDWGTAASMENNVLMGYQAGRVFAGADNNIAIGYRAGDAITTGSTNLLIGYDIDAPSATGNNQMSIGNLIFGTGVGTGTGTTISDGRVGIASNAPQAVLDVVGTGSASALIVPRDTTAARAGVGVNGMIRYNTNLAAFEVYANNAWATMATSATGGADNLGNHTATQQILATIGTANAPSYSFAGDTNTGIFRRSDGMVSMVSDGGRRVDVSWGTELYSGHDMIAPLTVEANSTDGYSAVSFRPFNDSPRGSVGHGNSAGGITNGRVFLEGDAFTDVLISSGGNPNITATPAGRVAIGTTSTTTGSILDVNGTGVNFSSLRVPRDTTANRPTSAQNGMIRYNTNLAAFEVYANNAWATMATSATSGATQIDELSDAIYNSTAQSLYLGNSSGGGQTNARINNTAIGYLSLNSMNNDSADNNTAVGFESLRDNTAGGTNTAVGWRAAASNTTGNTNTALGSDALYRNATGSWNTAVGSAAAARTTGSQNTVVGRNAMLGNWAAAGTASNNVVMGNDAMYALENGSSNVGIGFGVFAAVTDGNNNIGIGYQAGDNLTTGSGNIIIGHNIDATSPTVNNLLNIGNFIFGTGFSGSGTTISNGRIGIASNAPQAVLDVVGTGTASALIVPRDTTAARAGVGVNGMIRYNTNTAKFEVYETQWKDMVSAGGGTPAGGNMELQFNNGGSFGSNSNLTWNNSTNGLYISGAPSAGHQRVLHLGAPEHSNHSPGTILSISAPGGSDNALIAAVENGARKFMVYSGGQIFAGSTAGNGAPADAMMGIGGAGQDYGGGARGVGYFMKYWGESGVFLGYNDTASEDIGIIGGHSDNNDPTQLAFYTKSVGGTLRERVRLDSTGRVGIGTTSPNIATILDLTGTGNLSSLLVPRGTTAERAATAANGMIRYNTNLAAFEVYANNQWATVATGSGGGATNIDGLSDAIYDATDFSLYVGTLSGVSAGAATNNTGLGYRALNAITTGGDNSAVGYRALDNISSGSDNTAVGTNSLRTATTATENTALGTSSLYDATGSQNTGIGRSALVELSTGTSNTALGYAAGRGVDSVTAGSSNTLIGAYSGEAITTADNNTFLGFRSGDNVTSGDNNLILGYNIDAPSATGSFQMSIGNMIFGTGINGTGTTMSGGRIGIASNTPQAVLDVVGTGSASALIVPRDTTAARAGVGVNGMIRYNSATSKFEVYAISWQDLAMGAGGGSSQWTTVAGNEIHYSTAFVGIGTNNPGYLLDINGELNFSGATETGTMRMGGLPMMKRMAGAIFGNSNLAIGTASEHASLNSGVAWNNLMIGIGAGSNITDGYANTLIGTSGVTTGIGNTLVGNAASYTLTTGSGNTALGAEANVGTTGSDNIMIGNSSGWSNDVGSGNTIVGSEAMNNVASAELQRNTAVGYRVGRNLTGGGGGAGAEDNVLFGYQAGDNITTGDRNLIFGYNIDAPSATGSNQLTIGNLIFGTGANTSTGTTIAAGRVGIMSNAPQAALDVVGTGTASALIVPRDTTAARPTGVNGMIRYNSNTNKIEGFENNGWANLNGVATVAGKSGTVTINLDDLTDAETNGSNSVFIGMTGAATAASESVYFGVGAGAANAGSQNVVLGNQALEEAGGDQNVVVGYRAGRDITGDNNVAIGHQAGDSITSGGTNIVIGVGANPPAGNSNSRLNIGNSIYGDLATDRIKIGMNGTLTNGVAFEVLASGTAASSILIPRDTTANRPTTGVNGMMRYNTNLSAFEVYANNQWATLATGSGSSQWTTVAGNEIHYSTANVGIGTNNPNSKLHVFSGDIEIEDSFSLVTGGSDLIGGDGTQARVAAGPWNNWSVGHITDSSQSGTINTTGSYGAINFHVLLNGAERLRVDRFGRVGVNTTSPTTGAIMDLNGTGNLSSLVLPRGTTAQRAVAGVNGMIRYNTNTSKFEVYVAGNWADMATGASGGGDFLRNGSLAMTGNFRAGDQWISNDGDSEGIRIDNSGNVGIGTTSPGYPLQVNSSGDTNLAITSEATNANTQIRFGSRIGGVTRTAIIQSGWSGELNFIPGSDQLDAIKFNNAADTLTYMQIDTINGRVGIGTNNPLYKLHVTGTTTDDGVRVELAATTSNNVLTGYSGANITHNLYTASDSAIYAMHSGGTERNRLHANGDSYINGGNVGIGTNDPGRPLHVYDTGTTAPFVLERSNNTTGAASFEFWPQGAASPTNVQWQAGLVANSNSFTWQSWDGTTGIPRLVIENTGDVGIGTTTPTGRLSVAGAATDHAYLFYDNADVGDAVDGQSLYIYRRAAEGDNYIRMRIDQSRFANIDADNHFFINMTTAYTNSNFTGSYPESYNATEAARSSPKAHSLGIFNNSGVDGNSAGIHLVPQNASTPWPHQTAFVNAVSTNSGYTPHLVFGQSTSSSTYAERMRLDTAGNFGIGTTVPGARLHVEATQASSEVARFSNADTGASADVLLLTVNRVTPASGNAYLTFNNSSGNSGSVTGDGAGGVQYNLTSDRRLKDQIRDTHYSINDLMKIRVRDYVYKAHGVQTNGFVAQELYEAYPHAVSKPEDESTQWWQVDYGRLTPLIVKGVQDVYGLCQMNSEQTRRLDDRVSASEHEILALKREVQSLKDKNEALNRKLEKVLKHLNLNE